MGSKKKHNKQQEPPRRPTWLIIAAAAVAAVAAVVAQRSDPFRDLDDAAVAKAAFEALRDAQPKQARAAFAELVRRDADDSFGV